MDKTLFLCILQAWCEGFGIKVTENLSNTSNRDKNLFFLNLNMFILHLQNTLVIHKNSYGKATTNNNGYGHYL